MKITFLIAVFLLGTIPAKYCAVGLPYVLSPVMGSMMAEGKIIKKETESELQSLRDNIKTEKQWLIFSIVTAGGISMFLSLLYIDIRRKKRMLHQQKVLADAEATILKNRLDYSHKELTSQALLLAALSDSRNRFARLVDEITPHVDETGRNIIQSALKEYEFKLENDVWTEFECHFKQVHESFYSSLKNLYPYLTSYETRLCALLKLNLNTKDISMIQNKSVRGVESARYRLKKRLGLGENENLYEFLNSI